MRRGNKLSTDLFRRYEDLVLTIAPSLLAEQVKTVPPMIVVEGGLEVAPADRLQFLHAVVSMILDLKGSMLAVVLGTYYEKLSTQDLALRLG